MQMRWLNGLDTYFLFERVGQQQEACLQREEGAIVLLESIGV
jgi:hypothetical protein